MTVKHRTSVQRVSAALKLTGMAAALSFIMMMVLAGCPTETDPDPAPTGKTYTVSANGSETATTTQLTITFAAAEAGLTADNITITDGTGKAAKNGALSGTGPAYTLPVSVTQAGTITVVINKSGVDSGEETVTVKFSDTPDPDAPVPIDGLAAYLDELGAKDAEHPNTVKIAAVNISTGGVMGAINTAVSGKQKFVTLDLSDCSAAGNTISGNYQGTPGSNDMNVIKDNPYIVGVILPGELKTIGEGAFSGCSSLTSVVIPEGVESIGQSAFSGSSLASVTIPASVTSIGQSAFSGSSLASVTIPASVTSIGQSAFSRCTSLASVTIPASVTSIGSGAFEGCSSLADVVIPASVTSIGPSAFSGCTSLASVTFAGGSSMTWMSPGYFFPGDLYSKYIATGGGAGTYTTTNPGQNPTWTKR